MKIIILIVVVCFFLGNIFAQTANLVSIDHLSLYQNTNAQQLSASNKTTENSTYSITPYGYWQIPMESRAVKVKNGVLMPSNYLFLLDSNYITMSLLTEKEWTWKSEDDFYKLTSKWSRDSLFYLPPFGKWTYLAKFDGTNFVKKEQEIVFKYNKIKPDEISSTDLAILKKRKPHNYNVKPTN